MYIEEGQGASVDEAVPGTTGAFRRAKDKRPDIMCFVGEPHEDLAVICSVADACANLNDIYKEYLIPAGARMMDTTDFVHIFFRHEL